MVQDWIPADWCGWAGVEWCNLGREIILKSFFFQNASVAQKAANSHSCCAVIKKKLLWGWL